MTDLSYLQIFYYLIIPILSIVVIPFIRGIYVSINRLEQEINRRITEDKAVQLLSYHINPLKEDLSEIKAQLAQIVTKLINDPRK